MAITLKNRIRTLWLSFKYNFNWSDYVGIIENPISNIIVLIPLFGYIILFNDAITDLLSFSNIANTKFLVFRYEMKIAIIYYALIFIGIYIVIFRFRCPTIVQFHKNSANCVKYQIENAIISDYVNYHEEIIYSNNRNITGYGDYGLHEWENFLKDAMSEEPGSHGALNFFNWKHVVDKHRLLLTNILKETFAVKSRNRRKSLLLSILFSLVGYLMLSIISLELFFAVTLTLINL